MPFLPPSWRFIKTATGTQNQICIHIFMHYLFFYNIPYSTYFPYLDSLSIVFNFLKHFEHNSKQRNQLYRLSNSFQTHFSITIYKKTFFPILYWILNRKIYLLLIQFLAKKILHNYVISIRYQNNRYFEI